MNREGLIGVMLGIATMLPFVWWSSRDLKPCRRRMWVTCAIAIGTASVASAPISIWWAAAAGFFMGAAIAGLDHWAWSDEQ